MAQLQAVRPPPPISIRSPLERGLGIAFVVALHIAAIYAIANSLGLVSLPAVTRVLQVYTVAPDVEKTVPPPPPPPTLELPKPVTVVPEVVIDLPQETAPTTAITVPPSAPAPVAAPPAPPAVADRGVTPVPATHTIPAYPPLSRRLGETGTVRLMLTVSADGSVVDAKVAHSSGSARLDEAAEEWVKEHWRYKPAIKGGQPVQAVTQADVVFRLT